MRNGTALAEKKYIEGVVAGVFGFIEAVVLPSIVGRSDDLAMRFSLRELDSFRAGVFRSPTQDRYKIHLTSGMASEIYTALRSLPAKEKRFLHRQLPAFASTPSHDFQTGFAFTSALAFVVAHELSHALAGHVDLFRVRRQAVHEPSSKIKELEADGFALFLIYEFRRDLAVYCLPDSAEVVASWPQGFQDDDDGDLSRLSLFGIVLFAILLERHHETSDQAGEAPGFAHARLIYLCVGHILLERPDLARFDESTYRIVFDIENRKELTEYFAIHILPVLICCQRAADAAGVALNIVPLGKKQSTDSVFLVTEIAAVISGQTPGSSAGGEQLARLGQDLSLWYGKVRPHRKVETTI